MKVKEIGFGFMVVVASFLTTYVSYDSVRDFLVYVSGRTRAAEKKFETCVPETCAQFLFATPAPLEKFPIESHVALDFLLTQMQKYAFNHVRLKCVSAKHVGVVRNLVWVESKPMFNLRPELVLPSNNDKVTTVPTTAQITKFRVYAKIGSVKHAVHIPKDFRRVWVFENRDGVTERATVTSDSVAECLEAVFSVTNDVF